MSLPRQIGSVWFWLTAALVGLLSLFLLYPLVNMLASSFASAGGRGGSGWGIFLSDPRYLTALGNTVLLGLLVTLGAALIGVPLAYFAARYNFPGKTLIAVLPLTTLVVPEVIAAQTWLMMFGNNGLITRSLGDVGIAIPSFYGWFGLTTVMTFIYYTYVYIGTLAAIRGFDVQLEEAAQGLGTSPNTARWKVLVPVVMPAVLASCLLVFTLVVGNFAVATILGGRVALLSVITYQAFVSEMGSDPVMQSTLASVSIGLVAAVLFLQRWIVSRGRYEITMGRGAKPQRLKGLSALLLALAASIVVIISLLPLFTVIAGAFTRARGPVMRWGEWTTLNMERVFLNAPDPIINTLIFAGIATLISVVVSTLASYLIVKKRTVLTPALDYIASLPLALSGTVLGIGLVMSFNTGWLTLTGTAMIIVIAYVIRRLPFGIRNASSTLYNVPNSIEEASISLGVPPVQSFFKVVLPIMVPSIAAAAILVWTTTVSELSASIVVYSGGKETMPIQIFRLIDSNLMAQASAYGLVLVVTILLPIIIATTIFKIDVFASR
ncbi:MAG: iron ABC transporter permease [Methylocystis sp.]|nr:iron ABC transporter permease [Methylocystis sp.]MCA3590459.1 iron ABC transporter permease [Methylocystis sp.]